MLWRGWGGRGGVGEGDFREDEEGRMFSFAIGKYTGRRRKGGRGRGRGRGTGRRRRGRKRGRGGE